MKHLFHQFQTKDLGILRYFHRIEVANSKDGVYISHRKYDLGILEEIGMLGFKHMNLPWIQMSHFYQDKVSYYLILANIVDLLEN